MFPDESRRLRDRRSRPTPPISRYLLWGGRRRGARRTGEPRAVYVDRLGPGFLGLLALIFGLQFLDATLTLVQLSRGAAELNPLMRACLERGTPTFLLVKLSVAAAGLMFLGIHKYFPWVRRGLILLSVVYGGLVGYHLLLLGKS